MIKSALRSLLTVSSVLLLTLASVGCLLGPAEDPENPTAGQDQAAEPGAEADEYGSQPGAIRVDRSAPVKQERFESAVREEDGGKIGHGTPDPLNPIYMKGKQHHQGGSWNL